MNTSFLYYVLGVREQECSYVRYEDNSIILELQACRGKLCCSSVEVSISFVYVAICARFRAYPLVASP